MRQALGLAVFRIEANALDLADMLVEEGHLAAWDADDKRSVEAALATFVAAAVARYI